MATLKEIVFLGTGTSGGVPTIACLTDLNEPRCKTCLSNSPKNIRKNTSLLVRFDHPDGRIRNVIIDAGKTFYDQIIQHLPKLGVRQLDAVLLTHGHADAMFGLDDLRGWTMGKDSIQKTVPLYLTQETMSVVEHAFPYLVDKSFATGGGDIASLQYNIIDPEGPFTVEGLEFVPLQVEHGKVGDAPYMYTGFRFGDVSYVSDVSRIPDDVREKMKGSELVVLDALKDTSHQSHFSVDEALAECRLLRPKLCLLTGFCHQLEHLEMETRFRALKDTENLVVRPTFDGMRIPFEDGLPNMIE